MAAETLSIREAWTKVPSSGAPGAEFARFTGKRMERIVAITVAIGAATVGAQALFAAFGRMGDMTGPDVVHLVAVFGTLVAMLVSCIIARGVRTTATIFAIVYPVAVLVWPLLEHGAQTSSDDHPWIFFLVNVGSAAAVLAFPVWMQILWALVVPLVYGYAQLAAGGFSRGLWTLTGFDVSFTVILGLVIVALGWMARSVAKGVDDVRAHAVASYAVVAADAAGEEERVAIAALMHDSVLAALIAAERADTDRARDLAVSMAREALTRLANADAVSQEGSDAPVDTRQIVGELRRALSELGADAVVEERGAPSDIPGRAARAIVLAARQAIGNAIQHAQGRGLHVIVEARGAGTGVLVTVMDTGPGFDVDGIAEDRLGIRASIIARMAGVAGQARIESDATTGTSVILSWRPE